MSFFLCFSCVLALVASAGFLISSYGIFFVRFCREVDTFIEKLESTIAFLAGIEDEADDGFVPFI
jgi:hypothetical protein